MGRIATAIVAIALIMLVVVGLTGERDSAVHYAREEAAIAHYQAMMARNEALAPLDTALDALWRIIPLVAVIGALAYAGTLGVIHLVRLRRERWPRYDGLLPVPSDQLHQVAAQALGAFHGTRQIEAARQPVPHTISYHYSYRGGASAPSLPPAGGVTPAGTRSMADLLNEGRIGPGNPLVLGLDDSGAEIPGSWRDLYSTITAGLPGTGKTTTQRYYAAQSALHGATFIVCDPHAGNDESLAATLEPLRAAYRCDAAESPQAILEAVRYAVDIVTGRIARSSSRQPVIVWIDELTALLSRSDIGGELASCLEQIAQEGRKVGVYLSLSGQIWTASRVTSELRDSMASVVCHRMRRAQARLILPSDVAALTERLETGQAILWRTSGATQRIRIPLATAADVVRVGQMLGSQAEADRKPDQSQASVASGSAESRRALEMFLRGMDIAQIVRTLYGIEAAGGRRYQDASREVQRLLREGLQG